MGKAQSKRSLDITTDPKKAGEGDEATAGKVEKIEDVDQKEAGAAVNGDASPQEKGDTNGDKKESEESSENDKDLTTEKQAGDSVKGAAAESTAGEADAANSPDSPKDEHAKEGEEISPLAAADESLKAKAKKDKVKKKWSFRSISFGKKDKQKPAKSEEQTAAEGVTVEAVANGDAEKTEEGAKPGVEGASGDAAAVGDAAIAAADGTKPTENGDATVQEQQLNGDKTPAATTPTNAGEAQTSKPTESAANETTNTTETSPAVSNNETATATETAAAATAAAVAAPVSNGNAAADEVVVAAADATIDVSSNKTSIPSDNDIAADNEKPQQNGTNGDEPAETEADDEQQQQPEAEQIKNKSSQIEDIVNAKDLKENIAAAEITTQDLSVTCE